MRNFLNPGFVQIVFGGGGDGGGGGGGGGDSQPESQPTNFGDAFSQARDAGQSTFEYQGNTYTTQTAEEAAASGPAPQAISIGPGPGVSSFGSDYERTLPGGDFDSSNIANIVSGGATTTTTPGPGPGASVSGFGSDYTPTFTDDDDDDTFTYEGPTLDGPGGYESDVSGATVDQDTGFITSFDDSDTGFEYEGPTLTGGAGYTQDVSPISVDTDTGFITGTVDDSGAYVPDFSTPSAGITTGADITATPIADLMPPQTTGGITEVYTPYVSGLRSGDFLLDTTPRLTTGAETFQAGLGSRIGPLASETLTATGGIENLFENYDNLTEQQKQSVRDVAADYALATNQVSSSLTPIEDLLPPAQPIMVTGRMQEGFPAPQQPDFYAPGEADFVTSQGGTFIAAPPGTIVQPSSGIPRIEITPEEGGGLLGPRMRTPIGNLEEYSRVEIPEGLPLYQPKDRFQVDTRGPLGYETVDVRSTPAPTPPTVTLVSPEEYRNIVGEPPVIDITETQFGPGIGTVGGGGGGAPDDGSRVGQEANRPVSTASPAGLEGFLPQSPTIGQPATSTVQQASDIIVPGVSTSPEISDETPELITPEGEETPEVDVEIPSVSEVGGTPEETDVTEVTIDTGEEDTGFGQEEDTGAGSGTGDQDTGVTGDGTDQEETVGEGTADTGDGAGEGTGTADTGEGAGEGDGGTGTGEGTGDGSGTGEGTGAGTGGGDGAGEGEGTGDGSGTGGGEEEDEDEEPPVEEEPGFECPEGYEMVMMANGGFTCVPIMERPRVGPYTRPVDVSSLSDYTPIRPGSRRG